MGPFTKLPWESLAAPSISTDSRRGSSSYASVVDPILQTALATIRESFGVQR